jgi:pimeloyl-ACP methyl ester carboxylesterase
VNRRRFLAAGSTLALAACAGVGPGRTSGTAEVNGTRLYYETAGTGEPVVLVHAFTLDTRMWDDQFEVLARSFRVIRYDARGFGKSPPPKPGEAYSNADDLAALLDTLDARKAHVVGLSMGGRFALDYAVTYPDGLRSLVVIDGVIGGWQWSREWLAAYAPIVEAGRKRDLAQAKSLWLGLPLFAPARRCRSGRASSRWWTTIPAGISSTRIPSGRCRRRRWDGSARSARRRSSSSASAISPTSSAWPSASSATFPARAARASPAPGTWRTWKRRKR